MAVLKIIILFLLIGNEGRLVNSQSEEFNEIDYATTEKIEVDSSMFSDNELTHVRTKNLSGNVRLTTLQVLTTSIPLDKLNNEFENEEQGTLSVQINSENQDNVGILSEIGTKAPTDGIVSFGLMDVFNSTSGTLPDQTTTEKLIIVTPLNSKFHDNSTSINFIDPDSGNETKKGINSNAPVVLVFAVSPENLQGPNNTQSQINTEKDKYLEDGTATEEPDEIEDVSSFIEVDEELLDKIEDELSESESSEDVLEIFDKYENNGTEQFDLGKANKNAYTDLSETTTVTEDEKEMEKNVLTTKYKNVDFTRGEKTTVVTTESGRVTSVDKITLMNLDTENYTTEFNINTSTNDDFDEAFTFVDNRIVTNKFQDIFPKSTTSTEASTSSSDVTEIKVIVTEGKNNKLITENYTTTEFDPNASMNHDLDKISTLDNEIIINKFFHSITSTEASTTDTSDLPDNNVITSEATNSEENLDTVNHTTIKFDINTLTNYDFNEASTLIDNEFITDKFQNIFPKSITSTEVSSNTSDLSENKVITTEVIKPEEKLKTANETTTEFDVNISTKNDLDNVSTFTDNEFATNKFVDFFSKSTTLTEIYTTPTSDLPINKVFLTEAKNIDEKLEAENEATTEFDLNTSTNHDVDKNSTFLDNEIVTNNFLDFFPKFTTSSEASTTYTFDLTENKINATEDADKKLDTENYTTEFYLNTSTNHDLDKVSTLRDNEIVMNKFLDFSPKSTTSTEATTESVTEAKNTDETLDVQKYTTTEYDIDSLTNHEVDKTSTFLDNRIDNNKFQDFSLNSTTSTKAAIYIFDLSENQVTTTEIIKTDENFEQVGTTGSEEATRSSYSNEEFTASTQISSVVPTEPVDQEKFAAILDEGFPTSGRISDKFEEQNTENSVTTESFSLENNTPMDQFPGTVKKDFEETESTEKDSTVVKPSLAHNTTTIEDSEKSNPSKNFPENDLTKETETLGAESEKSGSVATDFFTEQQKHHLSVIVDSLVNTPSDQAKLINVTEEEPQISKELIRKNFTFVLKITINETELSVPSHAYLTRSPDVVNVTWKSSTPHLNNSLQLNLGNFVQLNVVKDSRMHTYKRLLPPETADKSDVYTKLITLDEGIQIYFSYSDVKTGRNVITDAVLVAGIVGGSIGFLMIASLFIYCCVRNIRRERRDFKPNENV